MKKLVKRASKILGIPVTMVRTYVELAIMVVIATGGSFRDSRVMLRAMRETGAINVNNAVEVLILIFVAIVIIYGLIPQVSNQNTTVQSSANVSAMGKFAAGLGEWMFPLLGIVAVVFLLFRAKSGGGKSKGT